jgi:hypothetical protein
MAQGCDEGAAIGLTQAETLAEAGAAGRGLLGDRE